MSGAAASAVSATARDRIIDRCRDKHPQFGCRRDRRRPHGIPGFVLNCMRADSRRAHALLRRMRVARMRSRFHWPKDCEKQCTKAGKDCGAGKLESHVAFYTNVRSEQSAPLRFRTDGFPAEATVFWKCSFSAAAVNERCIAYSVSVFSFCAVSRFWRDRATPSHFCQRNTRKSRRGNDLRHRVPAAPLTWFGPTFRMIGKAMGR